jgi:ABC-2 type transport system permease protein
MTTTLMTALALTREIERGTMENLLAMPVRPVEIMVGKILPYIGLGFLQVLVILSAAFFLFRVPMEGSFALLLSAVLLFIAANVTLGYTFSTLARTQMQAMQMTFFFFLPSILLSGFMFPFRGMPEWAQVLGQILPLTHFLRAVRGIMLKGNDLPLILPNLWPIALFLTAIGTVALLRFRRTLD